MTYVISPRSTKMHALGSPGKTRCGTLLTDSWEKVDENYWPRKCANCFDELHHFRNPALKAERKAQYEQMMSWLLADEGYERRLVNATKLREAGLIGHQQYMNVVYGK